MLNVRVNKMLGWMWANFLARILDVKFVLGEYYQEVDVLSRWREKQDQGRKENSEEKEPIEKVSLVPVNATLEDYSWDLLHSEHTKLQGMLHKKRQWNIQASTQQLIDRLNKCEVCRRHRRVCRDT